MLRSTYEEVCAAAAEEVKTERILAYGIEYCLNKYRQVIIGMGWTSDEIFAESTRRVRERIECLKAERESKAADG
jgi:hypothetical protein